MKNIAVLVSDVRGVFARIFCDFGVNFAVHDINGEPDVTSMIAGITKDSPALVTVLEETRHGLQTGDRVSLTDISGMENLNGQEYTVTVKDANGCETPVSVTITEPAALTASNTKVDNICFGSGWSPSSVSLSKPLLPRARHQ